MDKTCKECGETKPVSEFYDRYAFCKECKNAKRSKNSKAAVVKKDFVDMFTRAQMLQALILDDIPIKEKCEKIEQCMNEITQMNKALMEGISLRLKIKVPTILHDYLVKRKADSMYGILCLKTSIVYLTDPAYEKGFYDHFEQQQSELAKYVEFLRDLDTFIGFVGVAYHGLCDSYFYKRNSTFVPTSEHVNDHQVRKDIAVRFDPITDTIEVYGNPIRIDTVEFLDGLESLIGEGRVAVSGYVAAGYYAKFTALLIR